MSYGFIQFIESDYQDGAVLSVTSMDGLKYAFVQMDKAEKNSNSKNRMM